MPAFAPDQGTDGGRRQKVIAVLALVFALLVYYLPEAAQQRAASVLRGSILRPFIATQEALVRVRLNARQVEELQRQLDTLNARFSTHGALEDENRTLRGLLELRDRLRPAFRPASVLRPGNTDSESMFLVSVGTEDGVRVGSPVVDGNGLVGVVREVRANTSVAMDWTHPDFRASAMLADGTSYGIVETRQGRFREADEMILWGTAFNADIPEGMLVLTSGFGGVYPRGIPIGRVQRVAETEGEWHRSHLLVPMVQPASVTHVLVAVDNLGDAEIEAWRSSPPGSSDDLMGSEERVRDSVGLPSDTLVPSGDAQPADAASEGRS